MDSLCRRITDAGHDIVNRIPRFNYPLPEQIKSCDMMIVNGEGSMRGEIDGIETVRHRRTRLAMDRAIRMGKRVCLVNTVWHRQSDKWGNVLKECESISVREVYSAEEMERQFGIFPEIHPDESWFYPIAKPDSKHLETVNRVVVGCINMANMKDYRNENDPLFSDNPKVPLSNNSWDDVVNALGSARWYITGQHHGVYAACKARCPFVVCKTATHKVPGLFKMAGLSFPILETTHEAAMITPNAEDCLKLSDFLDTLTPWAIPT